MRHRRVPTAEPLTPHAPVVPAGLDEPAPTPQEVMRQYVRQGEGRSQDQLPAGAALAVADTLHPPTAASDRANTLHLDKLDLDRAIASKDSQLNPSSN